MILCIAEMLDAATLSSVRGSLSDAAFADGAATAGWSARLVKRNEQLAAGPEARGLQQRVLDALARNEVFKAAVLPQRILRPLFSRYRPGMSYGTHVDNAMMGEEQLRTDVSVTVFLTPPGDYDGGELVIETAGGEEAYKLASGSAVVYPSTMLHRVNEVTRGAREVAVTWAQSFIRSAERRELLFDLERARRALFEREGKTAELDLLHKTASNLRRMWVEP
jgi:PKHD-type hydroxylase